MSDNTQPASSRRALREKRRAEMEALLANSRAEQEAREQAAKEQEIQAESPSNQPKVAKPPAAKQEPAKATPIPAAKKAATPAKPAPASPAPSNTAKPAAPAAKPASKPVSSTAKSESANSAPKAAAAKTAAEKPGAKPADAAAAKPAAPAAKQSEAPQSTEPVLGERASLRRARDREALRERRRLQEEVSELTTNIPTAEPAVEPKPLTRRQLRLQALAEQQKGSASAGEGKKPQSPSSMPAVAKTTDDDPETTVMSVEEALAARRQHAPTPPVDPNLLSDDDSEIDLEVLAHQREMAARAAIISRRAAERERLRQENVKAGKEDTSSDPFTGALGNIREFEDSVARSGVSGPKTESVALDIESTGKAAPAKPAPKPAAAKPGTKPAPKPAAKTPAKPAAKRQTEAPKPKPVQASAAVANEVAEEVAFDVVDLPRVGAVDAQGLQPLDAQTAGVRRANNMYLAMIAALAVGGIALVAGIIMMFSN